MEKKLLSIGKVSKMKDISIKALRFYDRIGLVQPSYVSEETGYRYYEHEQLLKLEMIRWLKLLDLSLYEIASILKQKDPAVFAEFCSVQKQNALAKSRALERAICKLEIFQTRTHQCLAWNKHAKPYFRRIGERVVYRKRCPHLPTSAQAYDVYSDAYLDLRERKLETVYDTGSIVTLRDDTTLQYEDMFVVVIGSTDYVYYRDESTSTLPEGVYLCVCYQNHNKRKQISALLAEIRQRGISAVLCVEEDNCLNALDYSDPFFELQVLVSTYQINEALLEGIVKREY